MHLKETELCLGLPGGGGGGGSEAEPLKVAGKRSFSETIDLKLNLLQPNDSSSSSSSTDPTENLTKNTTTTTTPRDVKPPAKAQVVGWPPVRNHRKNVIGRKTKAEETAAAFVKVSMDGAPYLRKVDLKMYKSYQQLSDALANMFSSFTTTTGNYGREGMMIDFMNESKLMDVLNSSEYVPSYQDKDGDWMLVGDVPWQMFVESCNRLRIMKGSDAIGLAPRAMEKCKNRC
ncbi:hypothetical protein OSB04_029721 [Centaurea solstitialis]|uniref:Auxin-responsive protein n=1 Tax=Centaurea solstitialis TaxID=347529 RepID=A0AA38SDS8_9ASTR|nr:hypothetical protein OSB04_029721 [Centaurea solstitialis]